MEYKFRGKYDFSKLVVPDHKIIRHLKKDNLRKVFLIIYNICPCKLGEITDKLPYVKSTVCNQINSLVSLELIKRVPISEIIDKKKKTNIEENIVTKYKDWTEKMPEKCELYYRLRTGYYYVTDYGEKFIQDAAEIEGLELSEDEIRKRELKAMIKKFYDNPDHQGYPDSVTFEQATAAKNELKKLEGKNDNN